MRTNRTIVMEIVLWSSIIVRVRMRKVWKGLLRQGTLMREGLSHLIVRDKVEFLRGRWIRKRRLTRSYQNTNTSTNVHKYKHKSPNSPYHSSPTPKATSPTSWTSTLPSTTNPTPNNPPSIPSKATKTTINYMNNLSWTQIWIIET